MRVKGTVDNLCKRFNTRSPFEIADRLGVVVLFEPLGTIRGYYSKSHRHGVIHINSLISSERQLVTCAHELGHCILHPNANTPFLRERTLFSVDKFEVQANKFMTQLLISDDSIIGMINEEYTIGQISRIYGIPEYLVQYKTDTLSVYDAR